jgi:DNA-binding transcriptional LysR family regulator
MWRQSADHANADFLSGEAQTASALPWAQEPTMELIWLEDYLELARTGNFSRAAEARHLTQPAFSRRIRALEEWTGVTLFDRATQPVQLTAAGREFQPLAAMLIRRIADARAHDREAAAAEAGTKSGREHVAIDLPFSAPDELSSPMAMKQTGGLRFSPGSQVD